MSGIVTDSYEMRIQIVQHGCAGIVRPVTHPDSVEANTPFDIIYTTQNNGSVGDFLFGRLVSGGNELLGSAWEQSVPPNGTVEKTYHHPGISVETEIIIEVGHR